MRNIHLHGKLGKQFGTLHQFDVDTVADAIEALRANFVEFFNAIRHGHYRIIIGDTIRTRTTIAAKEDDPKRPGSGRSPGKAPRALPSGARVGVGGGRIAILQAGWLSEDFTSPSLLHRLSRSGTGKDVGSFAMIRPIR